MSSREQRWSAWHAAAMLLALGLALTLGRCAALAVLCLVSLASWIWVSRAEFASVRAFGAANSVTAARALLLVVLGVLLDDRAPLMAALCAAGIFVLDGVDGFLARRAQRTSLFGARLDMETDACLVLLLAFGLYAWDRAGAWVLLAGVLRYLYALWLWISRREPAEAPRSRLGRYAFAIVVSAFTLGLWPAARWSLPLAAAATSLLGYSFAGSFYALARAPRTLNAPR